MTIHYRYDHPATELKALASSPLAYKPRTGFYQRHAKRALDLILVAVLAVPALVILAIVMLIIALDGTSPIYRQLRVGKDGQVFWLWKLRSMVADADRRLARHLEENPEARSEWAHHQKLRDDPRITRIGRIIRKFSIDELPQLLNVLKGEMSLVGPRPMMINQTDIYPGHAYYEMRPGITGAWQVADRHETSFAERAFFDTRYYTHLSFATDLKIIWRTMGVVLKAAGV